MPIKAKEGQFVYWRVAEKSAQGGLAVTARSLAGTGIAMRPFSEMNDVVRKMLAEYEADFKQIGFDPNTIEFRITRNTPTP